MGTCVLPTGALHNYQLSLNIIDCSGPCKARQVSVKIRKNNRCVARLITTRSIPTLSVSGTSVYLLLSKVNFLSKLRNLNNVDCPAMQLPATVMCSDI